MSCWRVDLTVNGRTRSPIVEATSSKDAEARARTVFTRRQTDVVILGSRFLHDATRHRLKRAA